MKTSGVRFGIRSKLIVSFGFIIVLLALVSTAAYISLTQVDTRVNELFSSYVEFSRLTGETETELMRLQASEKTLVLTYVLQGLDAALETGDAARTRINAMRDNLDAMRTLKLDPAFQRNLNDLLKAIDAYEEYLARLEASLKERTPAPESRLEPAGMTLEEMLGEGSNVAVEKIRAVLSECAVTASQKTAEARRHMDKKSRDTKIVVLCITACALLLALIFAARLSGGIILQARHIMRLL